MEKSKIKVSIIRGAFLNPFEMQNYEPLAKKSDIKVISSLKPISEKINLPLTKLFSPVDLPKFPYKFPILNRLLVDAHYLWGLESAIKGSDIVHVAETYYHYTHQAIRAKQKGSVKKVVSTVWEVIPHNNEGIWGRKGFKELAHKEVDYFIAVTNLAKKALLEEGVIEEKISVIPMGVDLSRFHPARKAKMSSKNPNILCVARLVEEKGVGELVDAFRKLREKYPQLILTLVGDGLLKNKIGEGGGIIFKALPYRQIQKAYQQADIFCLPSKTTKYWQEQFGMALVEAMACGLPIVTTKTGAIEEVCGEAALYAKAGNAHDLQLKLERLIRDASLRQQLGAKARQHASERFDRLKVAQKISALYQRICP